MEEEKIPGEEIGEKIPGRVPVFEEWNKADAQYAQWLADNCSLEADKARCRAAELEGRSVSASVLGKRALRWVDESAAKLVRNERYLVRVVKRTVGETGRSFQYSRCPILVRYEESGWKVLMDKDRNNDYPLTYGAEEILQIAITKEPVAYQKVVDGCHWRSRQYCCSGNDSELMSTSKATH